MNTSAHEFERIFNKMADRAMGKETGTSHIPESLLRLKPHQGEVRTIAQLRVILGIKSRGSKRIERLVVLGHLVKVQQGYGGGGPRSDGKPVYTLYRVVG